MTGSSGHTSTHTALYPVLLSSLQFCPQRARACSVTIFSGSPDVNIPAEKTVFPPEQPAKPQEHWTVNVENNWDLVHFEVLIYFIPCSNIYLYLLILTCLKSRVIETFQLLVHSPNVWNTRPKPGRSQVPRTPSVSPACMAGPEHLSHHLLALGCISRKLDLKLSS